MNNDTGRRRFMSGWSRWEHQPERKISWEDEGRGYSVGYTNRCKCQWDGIKKVIYIKNSWDVDDARVKCIKENDARDNRQQRKLLAELMYMK